jgi:hypothetical protein
MIPGLTRRHLIMKDRIGFKVILCEVCGGQTGTGIK